MRALRIIVNSLVTIVGAAVLAVAVFLIGIVAAGYRPYVVLSGSMEPEIMTGSICLIDTGYRYDELEVGDVIAFTNGRISVTHRIHEIRDGLIQTKGDANESPDHYFIGEGNYLGKYVWSVSYIGYAITWLQTRRGMILASTGMISLILLDVLVGQMEKERRLIKTDKKKEKG